MIREETELFMEFLTEKGIKEDYLEFIKDAQIDNNLDSIKIFLDSEQTLSQSF